MKVQMRSTAFSFCFLLVCSLWLANGALLGLAQESSSGVDATASLGTGPYPPDPLVLGTYGNRTVPLAFDRYVNDFAGLLEPKDRFLIRQLLKTVEEDTEQRVTFVSYPGLGPMRWDDSPSSRGNFVDVVYDAWDIKGDLDDKPGHLLAIGHPQRHVLYDVGEGFRFEWTRTLQNLFLNRVPNPIHRSNFSHEMRLLFEDAAVMIDENSGGDWVTLVATFGVACLAFFGFSTLQNWKAQDPKPAPVKTKELARPRPVGQPQREITAEDLYTPVGFAAKKTKKKPPPS